MNLKLLSCAPVLGNIFMDKYEGPLVTVVQQIGLPMKNIMATGSFLPRKAVKKLCV